MKLSLIHICTSRINAYKIIEETLNLKDVRIFDYIEDEEGRKKDVLNKKETAIAQAKQELIKQGFQDWIWADPDRREKHTKMYNEKFNSNSVNLLRYIFVDRLFCYRVNTCLLYTSGQGLGRSK